MLFCVHFCWDGTVFDCISHQGHGIAIGSEMSGGVNDVKIWNCDIKASLLGLNIKGTEHRGGYIKNVSCRHSQFSRILVQSAVGYNNDGEAAPDVPRFNNFLFENLLITNYAEFRGEIIPDSRALLFEGFEKEGHALKNVVVRNIVIDYPKKGQHHNIEIQNCENLVIENITCR